MPEQTQTVNGCIAAQKECRKEIFAELNNKHREVMSLLGVIEKKLAYEDGKRSASTAIRPPVTSFNWQKTASAVVLITAAIATALVSVYAIIRTIG